MFFVHGDDGPFSIARGCPTFISGLCFDNYCEWWRYPTLVGISRDLKRYLLKYPLGPSAPAGVCSVAKEKELFLNNLIRIHLRIPSKREYFPCAASVKG
jgi:hypothetical protein